MVRQLVWLRDQRFVEFMSEWRNKTYGPRWQAGVRNIDLAKRVAHDSQLTGVKQAVEADQLILAVHIMHSVLATIEGGKLDGNRGS